MTSTVLSPLSRLGSLSSESLNAAVVIESSLGDWTPINKVKNDRVSPSKKTNIADIVMNSTGDLVVQSTPKNAQPDSEDYKNLKLDSTTKQQGLRPERTRKPWKTITVGGDSSKTIKPEDSPNLPFSLQDKNGSMLYEELNKEHKLYRIQPSTVTRLTRGKDSKHQHHSRVLRVALTNTFDIANVLLASRLLKSGKNVRILPNI